MAGMTPARRLLIFTVVALCAALTSCESDFVWRFKGSMSWAEEGFQLDLEFGSVGTAAGEFDASTGMCWVALHPSGDILVSNSNRVLLFDSSGGYKSAWVGTDLGRENWTPRVMAVDPVGAVYIFDLFCYQIVKFDSAGVYERTFSGYGWVDGIAVDSTATRIYAINFQDSQVTVFDSDGNYINQWGSPGTGNGEFSTSPHFGGGFGSNLAIDARGHIWIADSGNGRLQEFDSSGSFIKAIGTGTDTWIMGICANGDRLYVYGTDDILVYDALSGQKLNEWKAAHSEDRIMDLYVDRMGNVCLSAGQGDNDGHPLRITIQHYGKTE